ncbi:MAG: FtsX-like permease family protein [Bacteroidota bacterium]
MGKHTSSGKAVWSLLLIAFFILLLAWINYINLNSARAIERSREVGVRKVIGATRWELVKQFLAEALMVNTVSLGIGWALTMLALHCLGLPVILDYQKINSTSSPTVARTSTYCLLYWVYC